MDLFLKGFLAARKLTFMAYTAVIHLDLPEWIINQPCNVEYYSKDDKHYVAGSFPFGIVKYFC